MKIHYELAANPSSFNMLGIYEDAVVCYDKVIEICDDVVNNNINPRYGSCTFSNEYIHQLCKSKVKKVLNSFYEKYTNIFTSDYERIFANDESLKGIYFINNKIIINKNWEYEYKYKHEPIGMFIFDLELIAARLICTRRLRAGVKTDIYATLRRINIRIIENVEKVREERLKNMNEMGWQFICPKLYVFGSLTNITCKKNNHEIVPDVSVVPLAGRDCKAVLLPIHTCKTCGKKFIGYQAYKLFCEEYGVLVFEKVPDESLSYKDSLEIKSESLLHRLGYNVIYGELTDEERQELLITLLDHGIISYMEVSATIENNIRMFEKRERYSNAVKKWKEDIVFIGKYIIDEQGIKRSNKH